MSGEILETSEKEEDVTEVMSNDTTSEMEVTRSPDEYTLSDSGISKLEMVTLV